MKKFTREVFLYLVFGVLTTAINILTYSGLYYKFHIENLPANVISWIISVTFAFATNRLWVFKSREKNYLSEAAAFFGCRALTGFADAVLMYLAVDCMDFEGAVVKIFVNIIVIILNYIFSKALVFKKSNQ